MSPLFAGTYSLPNAAVKASTSLGRISSTLARTCALEVTGFARRRAGKRRRP